MHSSLEGLALPNIELLRQSLGKALSHSEGKGVLNDYHIFTSSCSIRAIYSSSLCPGVKARRRLRRYCYETNAVLSSLSASSHSARLGPFLLVGESRVEAFCLAYVARMLRVISHKWLDAPDAR
jgi:hypothetical protein